MSSAGSVSWLVTSTAAPISSARRCALGGRPRRRCPRGRCGRPSSRPQPPRPRAGPHLAVLAGDDPAAEHLVDGRQPHGAVLQRRSAARLADVHPRQFALADHAGERAVIVGHRSEVEMLLGHGVPHVTDRRVVADRQRARPHEVAHPQADVVQQLRFVGATALERPARLRIHRAESHRHVTLLRAQPLLEFRVADRGPDRVQIRVPMLGDVDERRHTLRPLRRRSDENATITERQ